eukprot:8804286-Ditylum_brightwellii.AAC.1
MVGILATINFLLHCGPQNDGVVDCIGMLGVSDQQVELNVDGTNFMGINLSQFHKQNSFVTKINFHTKLQ